MWLDEILKEVPATLQGDFRTFVQTGQSTERLDDALKTNTQLQSSIEQAFSSAMKDFCAATNAGSGLENVEIISALSDTLVDQLSAVGGLAEPEREAVLTRAAKKMATIQTGGLQNAVSVVGDLQGQLKVMADKKMAVAEEG